MKMIGRAIGFVVSAVVIIGILLGLVQYNKSSGGGVIEALAMAVRAVADLTVSLVTSFVGLF